MQGDQKPMCGFSRSKLVYTPSHVLHGVRDTTVLELECMQRGQAIKPVRAVDGTPVRRTISE